MIASIPWLQSALKYLHEWDRDLLGLFPVTELFYSFKEFITYVYIVILSCMAKYLVFLALTSRPISLLVTSKASVFFFTVCMHLSNNAVGFLSS
jgi:hypothetical protein